MSRSAFVFAQAFPVMVCAMLQLACGAGSPDWRKFSTACEQGDIVAAHFELDKPFDGKAFNNGWRKSASTPLHVAASFGRTELVARLLQKGVDPDLETENGNTPLIDASANGRLDTVRVLLASGAKVNRNSDDGKFVYSPALFGAVSKGNVDVARTLLESGASVHRSRPATGGSLLFAAALGGYDEVVSLLLAQTQDLPDLSTAELDQLRDRRPEIAKRIREFVCGRQFAAETTKRVNGIYGCKP